MRAALLVVALAFVGSSAGEWPHLVTTYGTIPGVDFANDYQPRTEQELLDAGWELVSKCSDAHPSFPGDRWARNSNERDIVIITDGNGYIAGIQAVVPDVKADDSQYYDFDGSSWLVKDTFMNVTDAYYATVYFVDTAIICNGGRTEEEFNLQGTGDRLSLQNGPINTDLLNVPLNESEIVADEFWTRHLCHYDMGQHYFNMPPTSAVSFDCNEIVPFGITYKEDGSLNGFVFHFIANLDSFRWEHPGRLGINNIIDTPPPCLLDFTDNPGYSQMHVWVSDYIVFC